MTVRKFFSRPVFATLRTIPDGDTFWVVGKDLLQILGIERPLVKHTFATLPPEYKAYKELSPECLRSNHERCRMYCISEAGMYSYLLNGRSSLAIEFRKFVVGTLLPDLRRLGQ